MSQLLDDIAEAEQVPGLCGPSTASTERAVHSDDAPLQRSSMVLDVEVWHRGSRYKTSYFVEHGVIHAKIGNSVRLIALNGRDAATMVASQLTGYLHQLDRKREQARSWRSGFGPSGR